MAQEYYTVEEAAAKLGLPVDELREMAKKPKDIRAFKDGASWKFRKQDIDELARRRSLVSDPEMSLSGDSIHGEDDINILADDEPVIIDDSALSGIGLPGGKAGDSEATVIGKAKAGPGSSVRLSYDESVLAAGSSKVAPGAAAAKPDSSSKLTGPSDSDMKLTFDDAGLGDLGATAPVMPGSGAGAGSDILATTEYAMPGSDKGRVSLADSDPTAFQPGTFGDQPLDASRVDIGDLEATTAFSTSTSDSKIKVTDATQPMPNKPKDDEPVFRLADDSGPAFQVEGKPDSDFDLSSLDSNPEVAAKAGAKGLDKTLDFESLDLGGGDDDVRLSSDSDPAIGPTSSGINLKDPADSGIALEDSADSSSSEFELNIDSTDAFSFKDDEDSIPPTTSLAGKKAGSTANLGAPAAKSVSTEELSSDFELALDEDDDSLEAESASEVVAIDESEDEDEAASEYEGYDDEPVPAGAVAAAGGGYIAAEPAPWPGWLVAPLVFTFIVLGASGIMTLEIMRNAFYAQQHDMPLSGTLISGIKSLTGL